MSFIVAIVVFRQYELLTEAIDAIWSSTRLPEKVIVFDNGGNCPAIHGLVEVHRQARHPGLAGAINRIHSMCHPKTVIIQNDDLVVRRDTFDKILSVPSPAVVTTDGFVCFREDAQVAKAVGSWDESFWPAYYEDADFVQRCWLKGIRITDLGPIYAKHGNHGQWSYQHMNQDEHREFLAQVNLNKQRFINKWGGMPSDLEKKRKEPSC